MTAVAQTPRVRLFIMMVLQFFIWGAWLPPLFHLMGAKEGLDFSGTQQFIIGSCFAIASVVGIFFSNQFADRNFSSERFMAFSHLIGGLSLGALFFVRSFEPFFALLLVHSLFYVPTISVANSLAFANLKDPQKEFGFVRMGGTIGWILAAWPMYFILKPKSDAVALAEEAVKNLGTAAAEKLAEAQAAVVAANAGLSTSETYAFIVGAIASLLLAAFSLTLPHTPPKHTGEQGAKSLAWLEALSLLKVPAIMILFIVTFIDATIHNGYFVTAFGFLADIGIKREYIMPVMSIGQVAEILTMAVLGMVLAKLGWRTTMILGILGHAARYAVFAFLPENQPVIIAVQILHGICYAFFFATVYIYIDAVFPKDVRTSAQGLFNLLILGIGDLAAKLLFVYLMGIWKVEIPATGEAAARTMVDYHKLFLVPVGMALVGVVILALFFHPKDVKAEGSGGH